jgi:signal peptidase I
MTVDFTDFSIYLLMIVTFLGVTWLVDSIFFRKAREAKHAATLPPGASPSDPANAPSKPLLVDWAHSLFPVFAFVLVLRSFLFEPFRIPSDSMMPTLLAGDFIFVSKYSYGLKFPAFNVKMIDTGSPQRGDVVVFRLPADPSINYIKRLIGLPGDHVHVENDHIYINGKEMTQQLEGEYNEHGYLGAQLAEEQLGAVKHQVMFLPGVPPKDFDAVVPQGKYFFMGDNRNNSRDGRFPEVGFVPEANLVGRAKMVWMHWKWGEMPELRRIGTLIH